MATSDRKRIAILGGGIGSLTAAYELTTAPDWRDHYDITVYQLGWRLGGKGASGRNSARGQRIEEHGLHVWFGCYDNAFRMLRHCYEEIGRPTGAPLATVEEAFEPKNETPYFEFVNGRWIVWPIWFPPNASTPGTGGALPTAWDYVTMLVEAACHAVGDLLRLHVPAAERSHSLPDWLAEHVPPAVTGAPDSLVHALRRFVRALEPDPRKHREHHHRGILWLVDRTKAWLFGRLEPEMERHDGLRRLVIMLDLALTTIRGLVADGVILHGFGLIDGEDTRAWFRRHGALEATIESAPMRALYDLYFAYDDGDIATPSFSAAVAVGAVLRLALTYKGAVLYEMRAGMGEVVIAPIYQALAKRGVRFVFFHRVDRFELSPDGTKVERVHLGRQVKLADGRNEDEYDPLVDVDGLPCWPSEPRYEQIANGGALKGVNLESWWTDWKDAEPAVLEAGRHYDVLILGIALAGLSTVCAELIDRDVRWRDLMRYVKTNQTQAAQLWMDRSLADLGWTGGAVPADAAPEPLDVWADRTTVLAYERWKGDRPQSLQYLCGPMKGDWAARPPADHGVPDDALAEVMRTIETWLHGPAAAMWPRAVAPNGSFDYQVLFDPDNGTGAARLEAQYLRANVDPTERYVLSVPGSARYRLAADESGCKNLVLAGDWTRTDWNVGCIEAAVHSGINAAHAVERLTDETPPATD